MKRETPVLTSALQSNQSVLCGLHRRSNEGERPNNQIVSVKKAADGRTQRSRKIIDEERKVHGQEQIFVEHLNRLEGVAFVILMNHASSPARKGRLSSTSKAKKKASHNKLFEKGGMPNRVESFEEVDRSKNRPRARSGLVKPVRNKLGKRQSSIPARWCSG